MPHELTFRPFRLANRTRARAPTSPRSERSWRYISGQATCRLAEARPQRVPWRGTRARETLIGSGDPTALPYLPGQRRLTAIAGRGHGPNMAPPVPGLRASSNRPGSAEPEKAVASLILRRIPKRPGEFRGSATGSSPASSWKTNSAIRRNAHESVAQPSCSGESSASCGPRRRQPAARPPQPATPPRPRLPGAPPCAPACDAGNAKGG